MDIISSRPVSINEVKEILEKRKEGPEKELGYEQQQTLDYAATFSKLSKKESDKLIEKLQETKKLSNESAIRLADIKPKNIETIKAILLKDKIELTQDEIDEIYKLLQ